MYMRSSVKTNEIRIHIMNLTLTMKNNVLDGFNLISIFDFLNRFVNKAGILKTVEALASLPTFLADPAETQFRTNLSVRSRQGRVTCWLEAVQYILRTYRNPLQCTKSWKTSALSLSTTKRWKIPVGSVSTMQSIAEVTSKRTSRT